MVLPMSPESDYTKGLKKQKLGIPALATKRAHPWFIVLTH